VDTIAQQPRPTIEDGRPRRVSLRRVALAGLLAAVVLALGASAAQAEVTASNITSPANPSFFQSQPGAEPKITIAGTTESNEANGDVEIRCYYGTGTTSERFSEDVHVEYPGASTSGTFKQELTLPANRNLAGTCILRAVPLGSGSKGNSEQYKGPRLGLGLNEAFALTKEPNKGDLYDFFIASGQLAGYGDYSSFSFGGLYDGYPVNPKTETGGYLFFGNDAYPALRSAPHSDVQVDGVDAFGSAAAQHILAGLSEDFPHFPGLTVAQNYDSANGNLTIRESEPLVKCEPQPRVYPPTEQSCSEFEFTGVTVQRTIVQNHDGRQATITDSYLSTDGAAHQLKLISVENAKQADAGYDFPWKDGSVYTEPVAERISSPATAPASVFVQYEVGNQEEPQGAITFSTAPDWFEFGNEGILVEGEGSKKAETHLWAGFARTVPAGGSLTMTQVFSWALNEPGEEKEAAAHTLAAEAEAALKPKIAIMSPATGMTVGQPSVAVSGNVTAGGNGMPQTVTINGESVPVAANGGWSATVPLASGQNTITASTTDPGGVGASAQIAVAYQPPVLPQPPASSLAPTPPAAPAKAAATIAKSGFTGKNVWLTVSCHRELACTGKASVTAKLKVTSKGKRTGHRMTRIEHINVGAGNFSISPGATETIRLKLTSSAKALVARLGKLFTMVRVTLNQPGNSHTQMTAFLVIRKVPAKHGRH
jgi:hypothetical protein